MSGYIKRKSPVAEELYLWAVEEKSSNKDKSFRIHKVARRVERKFHKHYGEIKGHVTDYI